MAELAKGQRITGADRKRLGRDLKKQYKAGASIRELAAQTNRSYGFVHRILCDEGVALRGRGGATRNRGARADAPRTPVAVAEGKTGGKQKAKGKRRKK